MTCANCAMNIERTLKKLPGINAAAVNFASEQAGVSYDDTAASVPDIIGAIKKAGFEAHTFSTEFPVTGMTCANCAMNIERTLKKKIAGVAFTLPLFILSTARDFGITGPWSHAPWVNWLFWGLATPVQFYTGWDF